MILFFVSDRCINATEAANLKRLEGFVSLIPVICHGDYYSREEVALIKRKIQADSDAQSIRWFDCRRVYSSGPPQPPLRAPGAER